MLTQFLVLKLQKFQKFYCSKSAASFHTNSIKRTKNNVPESFNSQLHNFADLACDGNFLLDKIQFQITWLHRWLVPFLRCWRLMMYGMELWVSMGLLNILIRVNGSKRQLETPNITQNWMEISCVGPLWPTCRCHESIVFFCRVCAAVEKSIKHFGCWCSIIHTRHFLCDTFFIMQSNIVLLSLDTKTKHQFKLSGIQVVACALCNLWLNKSCIRSECAHTANQRTHRNLICLFPIHSNARHFVWMWIMRSCVPSSNWWHRRVSAEWIRHQQNEQTKRNEMKKHIVNPNELTINATEWGKRETMAKIR